METAIALRFTGAFLHEERLFTPALVGFGVRIAADHVHFAEGKLRFRLLVRSSFPLDFACGFVSLEEAMVLFLRAGRRVRAARLIDPTSAPLEVPENNFVDRRTGESNATVDGDLAISVEAELGELPAGGVLLHLALLENLSNVIAISPPAGQAA